MDGRSVLIFIEDGSFTYDNRVKRESAALVADGWDVTVVSPKYASDPYFQELGPRLRAYFYPKPNAQSAAGHLVEHSVSLAAGALLSGWIRVKHGFSVFHACNPMDVLFLLALPYKLAGARFIFDQHDLCPELYLSRGGRRTDVFHKVLSGLERLSYAVSDVTIATNESYRDTAMARGSKRPDDVFVVRNGPDLAKFRPVPPKAGLKQEGRILVGYLGNMNKQDGVDLLLDAATRIRTTMGRTDIRFVLVGGGSFQAELAEKCRQMGLQDVVRFTGRVPDDEMLGVLCACDVCVQPDPSNPLNDKSTMNKVMEYMALGKPVVAFALKETRVSCGDAALYAKPNDVDELARRIVELADDPALRKRMGRMGRDRVKSRLAWEFSVPNLLAAYRRAMER